MIAIDRKSLLFALSLAAGPAALADVDFATVHENRYTIEGSRARDLLRQMRKKGPSLISGRHRAFGFTHWTLEIEFEIAPVGTLCQLRVPRVRALVTMTLPQWSDPQSDPALTKRWQRFSDALRCHEEGHREHGRLAAMTLQQALESLPEMSCSALKEAVRELRQTIDSEYRDADARYDAKTAHGRKQGVRFP